MKVKFGNFFGGRRAQINPEESGSRTTDLPQEIVHNTSEPSFHPEANKAPVQRVELSSVTNSLIPLNEDKYGIKILYSPNTPTTDIVFVHGLTGGQVSTWTAQEAEAPWPKLLLSEDIPEARISVFGYDADVANFFTPAGQNHIRQHGMNLLSGLADMRFNSGFEDISVIFVAHSMGGLVCQNALIIAANAEPHQRRILDCTRAIAFLGTPHHGSDLASWATLFGNMLSLFRPVNTALLETLRPDSEVLEIITQDFHAMLNKRRDQDRSTAMKITCYAEELPVSKLGKSFIVVPLRSAILPGYSQKTIHGDHITMTKFAERDNDYLKIALELKRWIREMTPQPEVMSGPNRDALKGCLQSLAYVGMNERQETIASVSPNTFEWIWDPEQCQFTQWILSGSSIYWLTGKPGSGKSTMMKFLCDTVAGKLKNLYSKDITGTADHGLVIATHFFDFGASELGRSICGMLRSLIWQILYQKPSLNGYLRKRFEKMKEYGPSISWNEHHLKKALACILEHSQDYRIIIFVDALDEYDGEDITIAKFLDTMYTAASKAHRICVASRPYPEFKFQFSRHISLPLDAHTETDIQTFVDSELGPVISFRRSKEFQELIKNVTKKARGNFRWVRLVTDGLSRGALQMKPVDSLHKILDHIPEDLIPFYQHILDLLDEEDRKEAEEMMCIVLCAAEPLSLDLFQRALEFCREGWPSNRDMLEARVDATCRGLLEVRSGSIVFGHETVESSLRDESLKLRFCPSSQHGHFLLAKASLRLLNIREIYNTRHNDPLLFYASGHWLHHTKCYPDISSLHTLLDQFSDGNFGSWRNFWTHHVNWKTFPNDLSRYWAPRKSNFPTDYRTESFPATLLECMVMQNTDAYVMPRIKKYLSTTNYRLEDKIDNSIPESLFYAAARSPELTTLRNMLECGMTPPPRPARLSALGRAIASGNLHAAELLLKHGVDPNHEGIWVTYRVNSDDIEHTLSESPIHIAIDRREDFQALNLLLKYNTSGLGSELILTAARTLTPGLLRLVLPSIPDSSSEQEASFALNCILSFKDLKFLEETKNVSEVTRILLEAGADPNIDRDRDNKLVSTPVFNSLWNVVGMRKYELHDGGELGRRGVENAIAQVALLLRSGGKLDFYSRVLIRMHPSLRELIPNNDENSESIPERQIIHEEIEVPLDEENH